MNLDYLTNGGGPAFPVQMDLPQGGTFTAPGMTMRDHFAALAPEQVPSWFYDRFPYPSLTTIFADRWVKQKPEWEALSEIDRSSLLSWLMDPYYDLGNRAVQSIGERALEVKSKREQEKSAALAAREAAVYFAWRYAYADYMLAERAK